MAGLEKRSIGALRRLIAGKSVPRRTWSGDLTGNAWKTKGSVNRPALAYACELLWPGGDHAKAIAWFLDFFRAQVGNICHCGRELGSRIYDAWIVVAVLAALSCNYIPSELRQLARQWLRIHWFLQALGTVPWTQGESFQVEGPTVTWTGMRSINKSRQWGKDTPRTTHQSLDGMLAHAAGMSYVNKRSYWEHESFHLDFGLSVVESVALTRIIHGLWDESCLEPFLVDLPDIRTKVPMRISRWHGGIVGTLIFGDIGTSTPPIYGMLMSEPARPAEYLFTHQPGDSYKHGEAREENGKWIANNGVRVREISLPTAPLVYSFHVDANGIARLV